VQVATASGFSWKDAGEKKHKISRKSIGGKKMAENLAVPKGNCWMFFLVKGRWFISNKQWYGKAELCTFMLPENRCCLFFGFPHYIAMSAFCCQFLVNWIIPRDLYTHELLVFKSGAEVLHQFRSFDQFSLPSLWGALLHLGARKQMPKIHRLYDIWQHG